MVRRRDGDESSLAVRRMPEPTTAMKRATCRDRGVVRAAPSPDSKLGTYCDDVDLEHAARF